MSKSTTIETNADKVYAEFKELSTKEMRKALRNAISRAASQLQRETKKELRKSMPTATRKGRYPDSLADAVKRSKIEETKRGEISAKVHIMGSRRTGSGTFRLRFFEKGTTPRRTSKGYNRGSIKALHFFASAQSAFYAEYDRILTDEIQKAINKINAKKK